MSATGRKRAQLDLVGGHERHPDDFYATPAWATRAILLARADGMGSLRSGHFGISERRGGLWRAAVRVSGVGGRAPDRAEPRETEADELCPVGTLPPYRVLDPSAGDGAILRVVRYVFPSAERFAIEIDHDRATKCIDSIAGGGDVFERDALAPIPWRDGSGRRADLVLANPPFKLAMEFLERSLAEVEPGGDVVFLLRLAWLAGQKRAAFHRAHPSDVFVLPRRPSFTPNGQTDSADYAWFVFGPGRGGRWSILEVETKRDLPAIAAGEEVTTA